MGSGCGCLIADFSFVCQTTPHFGSTSRKASYSVRGYITPNFPICKALSFNFYRIPHYILLIPYYLLLITYSPIPLSWGFPPEKSYNNPTAPSFFFCHPERSAESAESKDPFPL